MATQKRLASVDALRGLTVAAMLLVNDPGSWDHIYWPLEHSAWNGCTPTDLVYPFFLFIVGVAAALALGSRVEAGAAPGTLAGPVLKRAAKIFGLGLLLHALAWWLMDRPEFRVLGVLQRIGICFAVTGMVALYLRERMQWLLLLAVLLGYAALLQWGGSLDKAGNLASHLDTLLLGRHAYEWDAATGLAHDPEGLLSTLGALGTCLLGLRAGTWLRQGKVKQLCGLGVACLLLGLLWNSALPWNKQLWTSSFVLWTGGWASLALLAAHVAVDRWGWPPIGRSFGVNAIAAYAGAWMCTVFLEGFGWMAPIYANGFSWVDRLAGPDNESLAFAVVFVAIWAVIVKVFDRMGWYWKL